MHELTHCRRSFSITPDSHKSHPSRSNAKSLPNWMALTRTRWHPWQLNNSYKLEMIRISGDRVPIKDSTNDKKLTEDFGNVDFGSLVHGGSHVLESWNCDKKRCRKWRRNRTIGSIGTRDYRSGSTILRPEDFGPSTIESPERKGSYHPKSWSRERRERL